MNMTVALTDDKCNRLIDLCKQLKNGTSITIRQTAQVLGTMISYLPGVELGTLHYRELEHCKIKALKSSKGNYDDIMTLTDDAICDITWWIENLHSQYTLICKPHPTVYLETDSSKEMWGAVRGQNKTGGCWSLSEQEDHINILEMRAILLGLQSLCSTCSNTHIRVKTDNQTCVAYVNKTSYNESSLTYCFDLRMQGSVNS